MLKEHINSPQGPLSESRASSLTNLQEESLRRLSGDLSAMATDEDEDGEPSSDDALLKSEEWEALRKSARQAAMHFQNIRNPLPGGAGPN